MKICKYCLEAIKSRGEQIVTEEEIYTDDPITCEWCGEEETELIEVHFK